MQRARGLIGPAPCSFGRPPAEGEVSEFNGVGGGARSCSKERFRVQHGVGERRRRQKSASDLRNGMRKPMRSRSTVSALHP